MKKIIKISIPLILITIMIGFWINSNTQNESVAAASHRLQYWVNKLELGDVHPQLTGKGVVIAVIDSGIYLEHPDLKEAIIDEIVIAESDNLDKKHGTMIAGIIAAKPSSKEGITGVAPNARIISYDIVNDDNESSVEDLIYAIDDAISRNVDIINMSMGFDQYTYELHEVIKKAYKKNIILVASAGNTEDIVLYPAKFKEVIAVSSMDKKDELIYYYGDNYDEITVITYGTDIISTYYDHENPDKIYRSATGSSFSTAILTGALALLKETKPDITIEQVFNLFEKDKYFKKIQHILVFN